MFFRNLTLFRFPASLDLSDLETQLAEYALKPVGPLELSSRGFVPPFGQHGEALTHAIGESLWLTVGGEDKLLPSSVVNDLLQKKLAALGYKVADFEGHIDFDIRDFIRAEQKKHGLVPDGNPTTALLEKLSVTPSR